MSDLCWKKFVIVQQKHGFTSIGNFPGYRRWISLIEQYGIDVKPYLVQLYFLMVDCAYSDDNDVSRAVTEAIEELGAEHFVIPKMRDWLEQKTSISAGFGVFPVMDAGYGKETEQRGDWSNFFYLKSKNICFAGSFQVSKEERVQKSESLGWTLHETVSETTDYIFYGLGINKEVLISEYGNTVEYYSEEDFNHMLILLQRLEDIDVAREEHSYEAYISRKRMST